MNIAVLIYIFNGVEFLGEQLQSLLKQDISEKAEVNIFAWDDGSSDKSQDILDRYHREGKLTWIQGETVGKTKGYWNLLEKSGEADYYAFCEQDDVWFPKKLSRAIKYLETKAILEGEETEVSDNPLLYCSECTVTNAKLKPINFRKNPANKYVDFEHSLIYSSMPGCTYVMNLSARNRLLEYDVNLCPAADYEDLARNIIFIVGKVVFDRVPTMYRRKNKGDKFKDGYHGGILGYIKLMMSLFSGKEAKVKSRTAQSLMNVFEPEIKNQDQLHAIKQVANYIEDSVERERLVNNPKFVTGSFNDKWFKSAVKSNKL